MVQIIKMLGESMAAIRFTHSYDLLFKIIIMFSGIVIIAAGADVLSFISNPIEKGLRSSNLEWVWIVLMWTYIIGGYIGVIKLLGNTILPYWLPTYLYVRFSIFTRITSSEAERLEFLFDGSLNGIWYPLGAIRKIDPEFRREALFRFANKVAIEQGWRKRFVMPEDSINWQHQKSENQENKSRQSTGKGSKRQDNQDQQAIVSLQILGLYEIPKSFDSVKLAYRRKIREFHPDKFAGERIEVLQYAEEMSKRLNAAYTYLQHHFSENM